MWWTIDSVNRTKAALPGLKLPTFPNWAVLVIGSMAGGTDVDVGLNLCWRCVWVKVSAKRCTRPTLCPQPAEILSIFRKMDRPLTFQSSRFVQLLSTARFFLLPSSSRRLPVSLSSRTHAAAEIQGRGEEAC